MRNVCDTVADYTEASVIEGLLLLGDEVPDPDPDRRADLILALRKINRPRAIACLLYARGFDRTDIGRYFKKSRSYGSRLLKNALTALSREMNGGSY